MYIVQNITRLVGDTYPLESEIIVDGDKLDIQTGSINLYIINPLDKTDPNTNITIPGVQVTPGSFKFDMQNNIVQSEGTYKYKIQENKSDGTIETYIIGTISFEDI